MQAKSHLTLVAPTGKKRAVAPDRRPNAACRKREHLTETEIEKLIEAVKGNRYGHRDVTMILVAYRHGLGLSRYAASPGMQSTSMPRRCMSHGRSAASRRRIRFAVTNYNSLHPGVSHSLGILEVRPRR